MPEARSPFHQGEKAIQSRLGIEGKMEKLGRRVIRDHMPEQHQEFFLALASILLSVQLTLPAGPGHRSWLASPGSFGRLALKHST